ncbi:hypothetical protein [Planococcus sp. CAU13]|uniref:hypothetical protein n=1 Tax=Planococcus sp. CAU13 TaxID=1541197 RepID=UPI00052FDFDE|nr:hypothetical protein [Planococcus sp. CAU13]
MRIFILVTILALFLTACNVQQQSEEAAAETPMTETVKEEELEKEKVLEEKSIEKRLQDFLNEYSLAWDTKDYEKIFYMWEDSLGSTSTEEFNEKLEEFIQDVEYDKAKKSKLETSVNLIEILDEPAHRYSVTYMTVLVNFKQKVTENGEVVEESDGLAHVYVRETNSKYGFIIEEGMDYLE